MYIIIEKKRKKQEREDNRCAPRGHIRGARQIRWRGVNRLVIPVGKRRSRAQKPQPRRVYLPFVYNNMRTVQKTNQDTKQNVSGCVFWSQLHGSNVVSNSLPRTHTAPAVSHRHQISSRDLVLFHWLISTLLTGWSIQPRICGNRVGKKNGKNKNRGKRQRIPQLIKAT